VLGLSYHFMMGPGTDPAAPAQIDAALHDSYDAYPEVRYYRKDGSEFWAAIFISPIFGRPACVRRVPWPKRCSSTAWAE